MKISLKPISDADGYAECVECEGIFFQEGDLQLCEHCCDLFDLDFLWELHDKNELDALNFNENENLRNRFRKTNLIRW